MYLLIRKMLASWFVASSWSLNLVTPAFNKKQELSSNSIKPLNGLASRFLINDISGSDGGVDMEVGGEQEEVGDVVGRDTAALGVDG